LKLFNLNIEKLVTVRKNGFIDNMPSNNHEGIAFYAFGESPEINDMLYIGFDTKGEVKLSGIISSICFLMFPMNMEIVL
jgi:hypothetical protein